jgi:hypothetical protein
MADYENEIELLERYIDECHADQRVKDVTALVTEVMAAAGGASNAGVDAGLGAGAGEGAQGEVRGFEGEDGEDGEGDVDM